MKNKLSDLNDYLFDQIDRLSNYDLKGKELKQEVERSKAVSGLAKDIVKSAAVELEARQFVAEGFHGKRELPDIMKEAPQLISQNKPKLVSKQS